MREYKFRAWDGKNMFEPSSISWKNGVLWVCDAHGENKLEYELIAPNSQLMQFCGLKDKNGKEIYEGDIVFLRADWDLSYQQYFQIIWLGGEEMDFMDEHGNYVEIIGWGKKSIKGRFMRKATIDVLPQRHAFSNQDPIIQDEETLLPLEIKDGKIIEIIGNIYENPDLLANKQPQ